MEEKIKNADFVYCLNTWWLVSAARFKKEDENKLPEDLAFLINAEPEEEWSPIRLNVGHIAGYNESSVENCTSVWMANGDYFLINCSVTELDSLMYKYKQK